LITTLGFSQTTEKKEVNLKKEPKISFEKTVHDYGEIDYNSDGTYHFNFTNNGNAPLIIKKVNASCGCTTPSYPKGKPIASQDTARIKVKYNTRITGRFHKSITVYTNTEDSSVRQRIKCVVRKKDN